MTATYTDAYGYDQPLQAALDRIRCADCPAEIRHTGYRFRVVHTATCPNWQRWNGQVICGAYVTHRGPYKRRPADTTGG